MAPPRRRALHVGVVLLATAALLGVAPPAAAAEGGGGCPAVVVLGARGSGQLPGLGGEVSALAARLDRVVDGDVASVAVVYDASPFGGALADPGGFDRAVLLGGARLLKQTAREARRCPDADRVWAGFSQGALVVRAAMARLDAMERGGSRPAVRVVDAAVLIADPARAPGDPANRGPAPGTAGGAAGFAAPVADPWTAITTSWCIAGDPVCDAGTGDPVGGLLAHIQGYRAPDVVDPVARAVAEQLDRG